MPKRRTTDSLNRLGSEVAHSLVTGARSIDTLAAKKLSGVREVGNRVVSGVRAIPENVSKLSSGRHSPDSRAPVNRKVDGPIPSQEEKKPYTRLRRGAILSRIGSQVGNSVVSGVKAIPETVIDQFNRMSSSEDVKKITNCIKAGGSRKKIHKQLTLKRNESVRNMSRHRSNTIHERLTGLRLKYKRPLRSTKKK